MFSFIVIEYSDTSSRLVISIIKCSNQFVIGTYTNYNRFDVIIISLKENKSLTTNLYLSNTAIYNKYVYLL